MSAQLYSKFWIGSWLIALGIASTIATTSGALASDCAAEAVNTRPGERAVFLLVDRSASMLTQADPGLVSLLRWHSEAPPPAFTKWENVVDTISSTSTLRLRGAQPVSLSLGYFPAATTCGDRAQTAGAVATQALPARGGSLEPALAMTRSTHVGPTSLLGAIESGADFCRETASRNPTASCNLVLITDGGGDACDSAKASKAIAQVAALRAAGVRTHVLALSGADIPTLASIARAGSVPAPGRTFAVDVRDSPNGLRRALAEVLRDARAPTAPARLHASSKRVARQER